MSISFLPEQKLFHLANDKLSYIIGIDPGGFLTHKYVGSPLDIVSSLSFPAINRSSFSPAPYSQPGDEYSLNTIPQEFPGYDTGDYRESMFAFTYPDGTKATSMVFDHHHIVQGKKPLPGLPATYAKEEEADTLEITMVDPYRGVKAILSYTIFVDLPVITRSVSYINATDEAIELNRALSLSIDFVDSDFHYIQLPGAWARERQWVREPLSYGVHVLDSKRGASGVAQHPFVALVHPETTECTGEAYGFNLVYSGNFSVKLEKDPYDQLRVLMGLGEFNFTWRLDAGERFQTPEAVLVYSNEGLNGMSQAFHQLYAEHLCRGEYKHKERPVLLNNWETTYFDFNEAQLLALAERAKEIGVETFVLDDGWFGERHAADSSLGDWVENKQKFPNGLPAFARKIKELGLDFGLWVEPEMISKNSKLYAAHGDWHLHVANYPSSLGRNQLVLDFSRAEVRETIYQMLHDLFTRVPVDYVKWDMNRNMTEVGSAALPPQQQQETSHRYLLGLYDVLERLTTAFPHILFENCSGGAGRFDAGMSYYMPQSWTSDNTDAIERLRIQYGTSLLYPPKMMCAHLSETPNHQTGRRTDFTTRGAVAFSANLGLMQNLLIKSPEELTQLKAYIAYYKKKRQLIQFGTMYRIQNPFVSNYGSWLIVSSDKKEALFVYTQVLNQASKPLNKVKLTGLVKHYVYQVDQQWFSGTELMNYGLFMNQELDKDFQSQMIELTMVDTI